MPTYEMLPKIYYRVNCDFIDVPYHLNRWQQDQARMGYKFETNPKFQRGHVWTKNQQSKFIEWMLMGGDTWPIIFNHEQWMGSFQADMVCIDGLQRLTAICDFLDGKITAFGAYVDEFTNLQLRKASDIVFAVTCLSEKECLEMYIKINSGGTVHTPQEINKVKKMLLELDN